MTKTMILVVTHTTHDAVGSLGCSCYPSNPHILATATFEYDVDQLALRIFHLAERHKIRYASMLLADIGALIGPISANKLL